MPQDRGGDRLLLQGQRAGRERDELGFIPAPATQRTGMLRRLQAAMRLACRVRHLSARMSWVLKVETLRLAGICRHGETGVRFSSSLQQSYLDATLVSRLSIASRTKCGDPDSKRSELSWLYMALMVSSSASGAIRWKCRCNHRLAELA